MPQQTRAVILDGKDAGTFERSIDWKSGYADPLANEHPFLDTLWRVSNGGDTPGSMIFDFQGSNMVAVIRVETNDYDGTTPAWACSVDEVAAKVDSLRDPGWFSCSWSGSPDSSHRFHLSITGKGYVSVDYVRFLPAYNSTKVANSWIAYPYDDQNVSASENWTTVSHGGANASSTEVKDSSMKFVFTGTGLIARGWSAPGLIAGKSIGSYQLDAEKAVDFELSPPHPPSETIHDREFFQLKDLEPEILHTLLVTYKGSQTPLVLEEFLVFDGKFRVEPEPQPITDTSGSSKTGSVGLGIGLIVAIVVGVVGGLSLVALVWGYFGGFKCCGCGKRHNDSQRGVNQRREGTEGMNKQQRVELVVLSHGYPPGDDAYLHHSPQPPTGQHLDYPTRPQAPYYQQHITAQNWNGVAVGGQAQASMAVRDAYFYTNHYHPAPVQPPTTARGPFSSGSRSGPRDSTRNGSMYTTAS